MDFYHGHPVCRVRSIRSGLDGPRTKKAAWGGRGDGHGLSPADVAQIRNAAGQLLCRTNNGRVISSAWLMDAGRHILASLHSFFPGESERLAANPRDCHFIPSQDVKRRIALQAVQVADTARYLYIRNTPGAAPELVQRRTRLKKTPPDMEPIRAYDHRNFSPYRSTDYIVLALGPNDLRLCACGPGKPTYLTAAVSSTSSLDSMIGPSPTIPRPKS